MKSSLTLLALVAVGAVVWILFFADDGARDFFNTDFLTDKVAKPVEKPKKVTDESGVSSILPSFDVVRISRNGTGVIAGRAEPNSDVIIYAKEKIIGSAVADRNGEWVLLFDNPLPDGPTELSLKSKISGKFEVYSSDVVIIAVPNRDEERFIEDEKNGVIAILSPRTGTGPTRVLQKPRLVNFTELSKGLSLDSLDYDSNSNTIISGTATRNALIRLYFDNEFQGEVKASEEGIWSHSFVKILDDKEHIIRIDQLLEGDEVEVRLEQPFTRGIALDTAKAKGEVIVRPGNSLWHIARKLYGSGFHYTLIFGANKDVIKDPNLIYPGQKFTLPTEPVSK